MLDSDIASDKSDLKDKTKLQLIIGSVGIPFSIISTILLTFVFSFGSHSEYWTISRILGGYAYITGVVGTAFIVVGTIGILQRNRSRLAWIFAGVYIIGWIWRYAFSFVIFPELMAIEEIDSILAVSTISMIYSYSLIAVSLYAWWSIRTVVAYRPVYFSYLLLYAFGGIIAYLVGGLLFGFGAHIIYYPEESFMLHMPNMIMTTLEYLVLLLFFISQLFDSRKDSKDNISQDIVV